jgi:hypothetical protein
MEILKQKAGSLWPIDIGCESRERRRANEPVR